MSPVSGSANTPATSIVTASPPGASVRSATVPSTVGAWLRSAAATSTASTAPGAITIPAPESLSTPVASMSSAAPVIAVRSSSSVTLPGPPAASSIKAAMPAACGAAAEVPLNVSKPGVEVETASAAARSGFCSTRPPVDEKFPGVIAVPSASKKIRRGPSELYVSTDSVPSKTPPSPPASPTSTAATPIASCAAEWP